MLAHDLLAGHDLTGGELRLALGKGFKPAGRSLGLMLGPVHIVRMGGHGPGFQSYQAIAPTNARMPPEPRYKCRV